MIDTSQCGIWPCTAAGLGLCSLLLIGCNSSSAPSSPPAQVAPKAGDKSLFSLSLLKGAEADHRTIDVGGSSIEMTLLSRKVDDSELVLATYELPKAADDAASREAAVEAELDRRIHGMDAQVQSLETISDSRRAWGEVYARSPNSKGSVIRCRVSCDGKEVLSLVAVTPDNMEGDRKTSLNRMFAEFSAKHERPAGQN